MHKCTLIAASARACVFLYFEEIRWPCSSRVAFLLHFSIAKLQLYFVVLLSVDSHTPDQIGSLVLGSLNATHNRLPCVCVCASASFAFRSLFYSQMGFRWVHSFFQLSSFYLIIQITYSRMHEEICAHRRRRAHRAKSNPDKESCFSHRRRHQCALPLNGAMNMIALAVTSHGKWHRPLIPKRKTPRPSTAHARLFSLILFWCGFFVQLFCTRSEWAKSSSQRTAAPVCRASSSLVLSNFRFALSCVCACVWVCTVAMLLLFCIRSLLLLLSLLPKHYFCFIFLFHYYLLSAVSASLAVRRPSAPTLNTIA